MLLDKLAMLKIERPCPLLGNGEGPVSSNSSQLPG